jgi:hypothetical protein
MSPSSGPAARIRILAVFQVLILLFALAGPAIAAAGDPEPSPPPSSEPSAPPPAEPPAEPAPSVPAPTIASDLEDYPPGGLVTLTGTNWAPGEVVHIFVNDSIGETWNRNVDVTAAADGTITDQFNLPNWFVATYGVVATGPISGQATTTFTDASLRVTRGPTGSPPGVTFGFTYQRGFSTSDCSGTGGTTGSGSVTGDAGDALTGLGGGNFVKITVPGTPSAPSGYTFVNWTAEGDAPSAGFPTSSLSICVRNPGGSQDDLYRAHYAAAAVGTTTTVSRPLGSNPSTYGDAVTVRATVTGPPNPSGVGTVTFTDGAATLCSAVALSGNTADCVANLAAGPHSIVAAYSGATGFNSSTSLGFSHTVNPKPIGGTFTAANKVYDGTTAASVLTRTPSGVIGGDTVDLVGGTATFSTRHVGTAKPVTLTGASLAGASAANYSLSGVAPATADITARALTPSRDLTSLRAPMSPWPRW